VIGVYCGMEMKAVQRLNDLVVSAVLYDRIV